MGSDRVRVLLRFGLFGGPAEQSAQHAFLGFVWILRLAG